MSRVKRGDGNMVEIEKLLERRRKITYSVKDIMLETEDNGDKTRMYRCL